VPFGGGSYEIRLAGRLTDSVLSALECQARGLSVSVEPAEMVLYGPVQDQAALGRLLDRILSSGLEVVEVRRLP
jgi:3-polyprenyl-4-hydroxybenzoate decarboxylase